MLNWASINENQAGILDSMKGVEIATLFTVVGISSLSDMMIKFDVWIIYKNWDLPTSVGHQWRVLRCEGLSVKE